MSLLFSVSVETSSGVIVIWYYRAPSGTTTFVKVVKDPNGVPNTREILRGRTNECRVVGVLGIALRLLANTPIN